MSAGRCEVHDKMVHKSEMHWLLGLLLVIVAAICGTIYANSASVDKVDALQRQVDRIDTSMQRFDNKLDDIRELIIKGNR